MEVSVTADRRVLQIGQSLGERDGCTVETISDETASTITAAIPQIQGDGAVVLSPDHASVSIAPPSAEWEAAQQAATQQAVAAKQQTIDRFTATFHALNAMGGTAAAVPMLELALGLTQTLGVDVQKADLPPDLQQALAPSTP